MVLMAKHKEITIIEREIHCRSCNSSDVSRYGTLNDIQYYICKSCGKKFSSIDTYPNMRYDKNLIISALTYYYSGMSLKNITTTFSDLYNVNLPKSTVWRWLMKYTGLVNDYIQMLHPKLSIMWIADETVIFVQGAQYWLWDIIDTETRFLIASHFSRTRTIPDATNLFQMAKIRSETRPSVIITDKMWSYHKAFNRVFYSNLKEEKVIHITSEGFRSPINTNLIERFHGTIKQRTKVMRNLQNENSAELILRGFIIHYNFFMEHSSIDGMTPAEKSGIHKDIKNWGDLIDLALRGEKSDVGECTIIEQRLATEPIPITI